MTAMLTALGLMSGTSMDGIDAAVIRTDGERVELTDMALSVPYDPAFREALAHVVQTRHDAGGAMEKILTEKHAEIINLLLKKKELSSSDINVIGFHGHTIYHAPDQGETWQIGDGHLLANLLQTDVVYDFRTGDVEDGGQGAPLVPLYHRALLADVPEPVAVLNLGGVANLTYLHGDTVIAFDTGPGNALLDDWMRAHTGESCDRNGEAARQGQVDAEVISTFLKHDYFAQNFPKSLDRNNFSSELVQGKSVEDGAATLTAMTVEAVKQGCTLLPQYPTQLYVTGGGRHNATMMQQLQKRLDCPVNPVEILGWNGDMLEAQAFAFLAVRTLKGLPISLPTTTGVTMSSVTGGVVCRAGSGLAL